MGEWQYRSSQTLPGGSRYKDKRQAALAEAQGIPFKHKKTWKQVVQRGCGVFILRLV